MRRPGSRSARRGSRTDTRLAGLAVLGSVTTVATSATTIRPARSKEWTAPADSAEHSSDDRTGRNSNPDGRLVEIDRRADSATRRPNDRGQRGRDEQGVTNPPSGAKTNDLSNRSRAAGQRAEADDQHQSSDQRSLDTDPTRDCTGHQHRERHAQDVAGEQQFHLRRSYLQLPGQGGQDRID